MAFLTDSFAGSASSNLTGHTSDDGAAWAQTLSAAGYTGNLVLDGTGGVYATSDLALYGASGSGHTPAAADYAVQATFHKLTTVTSQHIGIGLHAVGSPQAYYILRWEEDNARFNLIYNHSGSGGSLGTYTPASFTAGTSKVMKLDYTTSGANGVLTIYEAGSQVAQFTDTSPATTAGLALVYGGNAFGTNSTGIHIETLTASDPAAGTTCTVAGPNSATTLPSNHNGNITLTLVGTGTSWTGSSTFTPSGVSGWAFVSKSVTDGTHATVTLSCPAVASPPTGATGTLTLTEGVTGTGTGTIPVATPTLAAVPTTGNPSTTGSTTFTGTATLWQGDNPQFTLSGGTGASIGAATATTNTQSSATVTYGSAVGALTVTDPSTGAQVTLTVSTATIAHPGDANWTFSPYNWYVAGNAAKANQSGAYFKVAFTGTSWSLSYTNSAPSNNLSVRYSVDGNESTDVQLTPGSSTLSGSGLTAGTHTLHFWILVLGSTDRWGSSGVAPTDLLTINSLTLDTSAALVALSTVSGLSGGDLDVQTKSIIIWGDSLLDNSSGNPVGSYGSPAFADSTQTWADAMAYALRAEYGKIGTAGLGWNANVLDFARLPYFYTVGNDGSGAGSGGSTWNKYFYGQSRLVAGKLSPIPDVAIVMLGANDTASDATIQASVQGFLTDCRAAVNSTTPIIVMVTFGQAKQAALTAAVAAQADSYVYLIDVSTYTKYLLTSDVGSIKLKSADGFHPKNWWHARLGAAMALEVQKALAGVIVFALPVADVSAGGWTGVPNAASLYANLDESVADPTDYIVSPPGAVSAEALVRVAALTDPHTGSGHTVRYQYAKEDVSRRRQDLTVTLYRADGTTAVRAASHFNIGALTEGNFVLTSTEADSIPTGDYGTGLVLGFRATEVS